MERNRQAALGLTAAIALVVAGIGIGAAGLAITQALLVPAGTPDPPEERFAFVDGVIAPVDKAFGIPRDELEFLQEFARPIVDGLPADPAQLHERMRAIFAIGWSRTGELVRARYPMLDERAARLMFAILRVNGSLPVYEPRRRPPQDLAGLLLERRGNCSEATLRTLLWLDTLGIAGRMVQFWAPSLPGHVVADVVDPESGQAFMLDASMNVLARVPSDGRGFFDVVLAMDPAEREAHFAPGSGNLVVAPFFQRWFDPGIQVERGSPPSLDDLNWAHYQPREGRWRAALTTEIDQIVERWQRSAPRGLPRTLDQLGNPGIKAFRVAQVLPVEPLLAQAGVPLPSWSDPARLDQRRPVPSRSSRQRNAVPEATLNAGSGADRS